LSTLSPNVRPPSLSERTLSDSDDFSLVLGGPLYQVFRRAHLTGDALELVRRRLVVLALFAWLPLLALSVWERHAWGGTTIPFLRDVDVQVRFLVALPLLVIAELVVNQRMRAVVRQFLERKLIPEVSRSQFDAAIASAMRLRNSVSAELLLIVLVYGGGVLLLWRRTVALDVPSWYGVTIDGTLHPTIAGWWFGLVSLPLFQFLLIRWYFRLLIWARFLWQVSRIELALIPTHPDRCGGLGFLANLCYAFMPILIAQGALLAGMIANRIFFTGAKLTEFKVDVLALVAAVVLMVLGPLFAFSAKLERAKRAGLREYGTLAQRYVREFDTKWLRGGAPPDEPFVGSADIQSLADLGNSFDVIKEMRIVPFNVRTVFELGVVTLLPIAPLLLTMIPLEELLDRLLKVIF